MKSNKKPVAFFDIDGTLFRSSLLIEIVEGLIKSGVFPPEAETEFSEEWDRWKQRKGSYDDYIYAVIETYLKYIKGVHYGEFADVAKAVVDKQSNHVYRYTRDLIKQLKDDGYFLVAISQSPKKVLDGFCEKYGFDKVYGRIYEIGPQDCFTGNLTDVHLIENKANIVKRVFEREQGLTRENSVGVGDTDGDISLLESVDNPICFNPNKELYDHAKRLRWEIVVERKDVVYHTQ